ncbi:LytTR family DNA-binding domain-containing protein [Maribellus sp. YY47]|uniref:LytR/AlgR family response regulator transcription factor n=1 Tax=Maribellus sp. YY47 TaxID=2929486 RepID=UPI002001C716|nr:LytTR family DNA-binding domain-containing protein [Maribellus sp. YY47]MCK3686219.1 LytTR family DNA-binding domain-containing protein [Maribellus sp. YY47]
MEINALIIDDEPLAQNVIKQYAQKLPELKIVATCNEAICAHKILQEEAIDLIFLDINMPKMSGISFLKNLTHPPLVIFTTAYSEYALEGFELNAVDYLKKPFSFDRFCKAFYRAEELLRLKKKVQTAATSDNDAKFLFIKSNKKSYKINFSDILFVEGLGDYIKVHVKGNRHITNLSMKKMQDLLPADLFYRIHKSYIISVNNIESVEGNMVSIDGNKLPIGNSYRQDFFDFIGRFSAE